MHDRDIPDVSSASMQLCSDKEAYDAEKPFNEAQHCLSRGFDTQRETWLTHTSDSGPVQATTHESNLDPASLRLAIHAYLRIGHTKRASANRHSAPISTVIRGVSLPSRRPQPPSTHRRPWDQPSYALVDLPDLRVESRHLGLNTTRCGSREVSSAWFGRAW